MTTQATSAAASASTAASTDLHASEVALLVDHYLHSNYPAVTQLFRMEAKQQLQLVHARTRPRSLHGILNEYMQLKANAGQKDGKQKEIRVRSTKGLKE